MNVLFLIQDANLPSSRIRIQNLVPELEGHGINCVVRCYPKKFGEKLTLFKTVTRYDAVYLQKKLPTLFEFYLLRQAARKLIFDFDDAIYCRHDAKKHQRSFTRRSRFQRIVRHSDLVIAGNDFLAKAAQDSTSSRVVIIPSAVETRQIPVKKHEPNLESKVVIGWVGTAGNFSHLAIAIPSLIRLAQETRIELRVISNQPPEFEFKLVRFIPWSLETQAEEIAHFDIGIMPLPATEFSAGKCGYKALQYMAAGIPPVVSDVGGNSQIIAHGIHGLVVAQPNSFYSALKSLIQKQSLRIELGRNARERVESLFSIHVIGKMLAVELLALLPSAKKI